MRRLILFLGLAGALAIGAAPALADEQGGGAKNVVLTFNFTDGLQADRSGVLVSSIAADNVGSENLAMATSSCEGCRTVAAAMQVVLITSDASVIQPHNAAVAVNENCTSCQTFAAAYQYVITTGGPVHLTAAGQLEVDRIRGEVAAAVASNLTFPELAARLDVLYGELKATIDSKLVGAGTVVATATRRSLSAPAG